MYCPEYICKAVSRLHPQLRMAWAGGERLHADHMNPGSFALVQLYHVSDTGTEDDPATYLARWDVDFVQDVNGTTAVQRAV